MNLNGLKVIRRTETTIFVRLPVALWRSTGGACHCDVCKGGESYWDTLAIRVAPKAGESDTTWTVHMPDAPSVRLAVAVGR